jgi:DNA-directed RNA polymerase specialized sigma24 family protein
MSRIFLDEQTLIDRLSLNDTEAFEELYFRHWHGLYIYCLKKLHSPQDSKIIVREIFKTIWEMRSSFPVSFSLSKYLYEEVRKQVVKTLNEKLATATETSAIEERLTLEFSVESLQAAKKPAQKKYAAINSRSELLQQAGQLNTQPNKAIDNIKWIFHSVTTKLSLNNILSYPKN